jgi:hypothetical protein
VSIKGLELQGTSCHAVEASAVDEVFDAALIPDSVSAAASSSLVPLSHWCSALTPLTTVEAQCYSGMHTLSSELSHQYAPISFKHRTIANHSFPRKQTKQIRFSHSISDIL